jgi:drug/metabolite transporter (DMT)-like permease
MVAVGSSVAAASILIYYPLMGGQAGRYALASMALFGWARLIGTALPRPTTRDLLQLSAVAFVGLAGFNVLLIAATARTDPSLVGAIVGTAPVMLAVLGALQTGRRPSPKIVAAAAVVAVGAAMVQEARVRGGMVGTLLAVGAMLGEVGFSLMAVPVLRRLGPMAVSAHATWLAAAILAAGAIATEGSAAFRVPSGAELATLLYLAVVVTAIAFVLWYTAVDRLGAETAGLFAGLVPVSALVSSALLCTDRITLLKSLGVCIVGLGVVIGIRVPGRLGRHFP